MSWKIERLEKLDCVHIKCPACGEVEETTNNRKATIEKAMKKHSNCIAGDSISFEVRSFYYPICSANCEFCDSPNGEERWGVYCCASCEATIHKLRIPTESINHG